MLAKSNIQAALLSKDFLTAMKRADIVQQFVALDLQPEYAALINALNAELAPTLAKVDLIKMFHDHGAVERPLERPAAQPPD